MSDFAPFVAATLRDKTIVDLLEENEKLRKQNIRLRTVEITGPEGDPVYAKAQFDKDGRYFTPNLWQVRFSEQLQPCPLSDLAHIEIRVGGMCKAKFSRNGGFHGYPANINEVEEDENEKMFGFYFGGFGKLWLGMSVRAIERWPDATIDPEDLLTYLVEEVANEAPLNKTVEFKDVCFVASSVNGALKDIQNDPETLREAERRRQQNEFLGSILGRMRSAGIDDQSAAFLSQALELESALNALDIHEVGERFDETIDSLIDLQARLHANEARDQNVDNVQQLVADFTANSRNHHDDSGNTEEYSKSTTD